MILEASMCDEMDQVQTLMLTKKNLIHFDDNRSDKNFVLTELCNIECVYASHNMLTDIFGICQLTTLVELNLSFNQISNIR